MKTKNTFIDFWRGLSPSEREEYAERAGTTVKYITTHLAASPPRKTPRQKLMTGLVEASRGRISQGDLLRHFYRDRN